MITNLNKSERRVLQHLWRVGDASRAEIAAALGLTKPAVTQLARGLSEKNLIVELAPMRGQRGQPSRPVRLAADAFVGAGINFSHTYLEAGIVDLSGRLLGLRRAPLTEATVDTIATVSAMAVKALCAELRIGQNKLLGIGFAVPGDFLPENKLAAHAYFPQLLGLNLCAEFQQLLEVPVFVESDGKTCATGELIVGAGRDHRSFLVVHIGHGVGGGIVIDGKIHRGVRGNAGPIGGFFPPTHPRPSGQDLFNFLKSHGLRCEDFDGLDELVAEQNCHLHRWIERAAEQLQDVVPRVASVLDPTVVVLGGRLPTTVLDVLVQRIDMRAPFLPEDPLYRPSLIASKLGSHAGVVGAALLPVNAFLMP